MIYVKRKGITLKVDIDYSYNPNPRKDEDCLGTMACYHSRYNLGDEDVPKTYEEWLEWSEENKDNICCMLPLYLLDHSGLSMSVFEEDFINNKWDTRQVGWIYCTKEQAEKAGLDSSCETNLADLLIKEVEAYDEYLEGVPYCYFCLRDENDEIIDSVTGFKQRKLEDMFNEMQEYVDEKYHFLFKALLKKHNEACL